METLDDLIKLKEEKENAYNSWKAQLNIITNKLYECLNSLNPGPSNIFSFPNRTVCLENNDWPLRDSFKWKINIEIYFENKNKKESDRPYDFGSSFTLSICNDGIRVNVGTCGEWSKKDEGQLTRIRLLDRIFDNELHIIQHLEPYVNFENRKRFDEIRWKISKIERDLMEAEKQREKKQILFSIHSGQYLAKLGYHWDYQDINSPSKKVLHYYDFEKILKITEKSIITDVGKCGTHRFKIDDIVYKIKHKSLFVVNSTDDTPPEGLGS